MALNALGTSVRPTGSGARGKRLRRAHRVLGLVLLASVACSTVSGVLHVVMTWTQAPPPAPQPAGEIDPAAVTVPLAEAVGAAGLTGSVAAASLRPVGGDVFWQLHPSGGGAPVYVDARRGALDPAADARYAAEIASAYLGGQPVRHAGLLTDFDAEYIAIFRLLPVHRLAADDGRGTRLYVSTVTGSVARHTDDWRQLEADLFGNLHKLAFIPWKPLRDGVLATLTGGILVLAVLGVALAVRSRRRRAPRAAAGVASGPDPGRIGG